MSRNLRTKLLRAMYIYTTLGAGGFGLTLLVAPAALQVQDPLVGGIAGSTNLGFALVALLGLRSPFKFTPVLLLQLVYKLIWFGGVFLPLWLTGQYPASGISVAIAYATFVIGDLIVIPFSQVLAKGE